jgi:transcriptional repressor NrdR
MRCPKCKRIEDRVIDSRPVNHCSGIRRRRVCLNCAFRFTTYEEIEHAALLVIKRDGRHEPFDRHKLRAGIIKACEKRPVGLESVDQAIEEIVQDLEMTHDREIRSQELGAKVMEKLHIIDKVAYVRYASVYRQFEDVGAFLDEINRLERRPIQNGQQSELFN